MSIKVLVNGAFGKMGLEVVRAVENESGLTLVGQSDIKDKLDPKIMMLKPDVVVDFTHPSSVMKNTTIILKGGACPVVGTTGLTEKQLNEIHDLATKEKRGVIVAPNFAIGAILMMKCAQEVAKYMSSVEIIEYHHDKKADSPSGTAIKTAELVHEQNKLINTVTKDSTVLETIKGCRGGTSHNIPIHSVRLPGYVAHQEVIFGGIGQTLSIRHDTINRESFMPGVILSIKKVVTLKGLVYGLENII
ncbi:MAG: 4-hydroxy-tetrahydrodipicolinate reductase [Candidatus Margulisbacteria bacterium]|nr:4-hydroxy-tetrahydrodipicolinate reductase [Candidatus Margulisiibacteriota bacterium]